MELELQTVVSRYVGSGKQALVLCTSKQVFVTAEPSRQPHGFSMSPCKLEGGLGTGSLVSLCLACCESKAALESSAFGDSVGLWYQVLRTLWVCCTADLEHSQY